MENETGEVQASTEQVATEGEAQPTESVEELRAKLVKAEEIAENQKRRAEKAEKKAKETRATEGLATNDVLYLAKTDIDSNDIDDVVEYASKMGVSVKDAHDFYRPILNARAEERRTANATNTGGSARGTVTVKGEDLLLKAERTGEVPEDTDGMLKLAQARLSGKR